MHTAVLLILCAAGLAAAVLSALEGRVAWVDRICAFFGQGCKRTARFTLLGRPVSWWGAAYYLLLALAVLWARPLVFWLAMAGLGFELTFVWIMLTIRVFCVFCLFNALAVAGISAVALAGAGPERLWQAAATVLALFVASNALLSRENVEEMEGRAPGLAPPPEEPARPAARVDGEPISEREVERALVADIHELEMRVFHLKRRRAEQLVRRRLLELEARERNMEPDEYRRELLAGAEVSDQEVEEYLREHKDALQDPERSHEDIGEDVRERLEEQKREQALAAWEREARRRHDVEILLEEPPLPAARVSVEGCPCRGPVDAPVVVVAFSDYLCPACRAAHKTVNRLRERFQGRVRWVFKDFPLPMHPGARRMHAAAHCAEMQGAFWEFQERMFASQGAPDMEDYEALGHDLDLDVERLLACIERGDHLQTVDAAVQEGKAAGVRATPTFIVNGAMHQGAPSEEEFARLIQEALDGRARE
jgi:predicted DsbA family dithiol-disulfide isomerase